MKYEKGRRKVEKSEGQLVIQGLTVVWTAYRFYRQCKQLFQILQLVHQKIGWIPYKLLSNSLQFNSTPKIFLNLVRNYYQELCFFASQNSVLKSKHLPPSCLLSTFEATNFLTFDNWDWLKIPAVTATSMHSRWTIT